MTTQTSIDFQSTFEDILKMGDPFKLGVHAPINRIKNNMEKIVETKVIEKSVPCVVQGWQDEPGWAPDVFTMDSLGKQLGSKSNMPTEMVAETRLLYLGIGGTCLMLYADKKSASLVEAEAIWFVIPSTHYAKARAYWRGLNQSLDSEDYFASLQELSQAEFPIYVLRQRVGDLVILPPRAIHQVVNLGGASIKYAWNRATAQALQLAVHNVIPLYRMICRPESYRVLLLVKNSLEFMLDILLAYDTRIGGIERTPSKAAAAYASRLGNSWHRDKFARDYRILLCLYAYCLRHDAIMPGIIPDTNHQVAQPTQRENREPTRCDFCQTDIWNRQFVCLVCATSADGHDICLECVGRGRTCQHHASHLRLVEVFPTQECLLLWTQATTAWNTSTKLVRLREAPFPLNLDLQAPETATAPFSAASVAYLRHVGPRLPSQNVACHRCGATDRHLVNKQCQSPTGCRHAFCERCMYNYHGDKWHNVVASRAALWNCYACRGVCMCGACRAAAPIVLRGRWAVRHAPHEWFALPDSVNRPAVSDPPLE
ncbi:hypothetical protein DFQ27_003428 [Actinomortierella ambigua]|uniref:JmjC domain-containing protein n=1 Tax=Actinomortierella ambigua TaxID=1343610 RepID=A0A9P6U5N2_9FUNG|nr:hypothetical protein DFQ27_003428 [Actinomortierella ambigua]